MRRACHEGRIVPKPADNITHGLIGHVTSVVAQHGTKGPGLRRSTCAFCCIGDQAPQMRSQTSLRLTDNAHHDQRVASWAFAIVSKNIWAASPQRQRRNGDKQPHSVKYSAV